jgi:uncharacterized membrane protein YphA (DoxX/SURF4 family)
MDALVSLLIMVVIFAVVAYGAWWVCTKFGAPQPVFWIVGLILLLFLLYFLVGQFGGGHSFRWR